MGLLFNMSPLEKLFINTYNIPFETKKKKNKDVRKERKEDGRSWSDLWMWGVSKWLLRWKSGKVLNIYGRNTQVNSNKS